MDPNIPATTHFLIVRNNSKCASYFVMNGCISLKFFCKSKVPYCSHEKKIMKEMFCFLNIVKIVAKSDLKYAKYRNQVEIYQQIMSLKIT